MWLLTNEYVRNILQNFLFQFQTGLPDWIPKSDPVLVYMKKNHYFEHFLGRQMSASRPLIIPKEGARGGKTWPSHNTQNKLLAGSTLQSLIFLILLSEPHKITFLVWLILY